jgi:DNA polymerase IV
MEGSQSSTKTSSIPPLPKRLDLSFLPPVFILPTHLTLLELHEVEERLNSFGAALTYDVTEAKLILGKIGTKKRAEFELRCRKLWTQEVPASDNRARASSQINGVVEEPAAKRRRTTQEFHQPDPSKTVVVIEDSSTESEGVVILRSPPGQGERQSHSQTSTIGAELSLEDDESVMPISAMYWGDTLKIVKLEWLHESCKQGHLLPLEPFVVYHARHVSRSEDAVTPEKAIKVIKVSDVAVKKLDKSPYMKEGAFQGILERAGTESGRGSWRRGTRYDTSTVTVQKEFRGKSFVSSTQQSSQRHSQIITRPTHMLHQTTSEHDEGVSSELPEMPSWVKEQKIYACERLTPPNSPNRVFIDQLEKIKLARILTGDEIGVRAYSTSIASLAAYPHTLSNTREILALPGCDTKIAHLFHEWETNDGRIQAVVDIENDDALNILHLFWEIWGVGAKTAREFYYDKGWQDLDDIVEHGWNTLSRVQQIGVKYYDEFLVKIPRPEVEFIAAKVLEHAKRIRDDGIECCIVGGYRRGKEACGDVDMILTHRDENATWGLVRDIVASLETEGWITHTLTLNLTASKRNQQTLPFISGGGGHGFDTLDKALVVWQDIDWPSREADLAANPKAKNPNIHRRVDIIIAPWRTVGCAIVGWSGGTTFQRDLRRYARKVKGWKFDSSGLRDRATGEVLDLEAVGGTSESWEEAEKKVFSGLGLVYREPWERCTG